MNAPTERAESTALVTAERPDYPAVTDTAALILQGDALDRIERFAKMMASGKLAVPRHFSGQPADCFAVCLQAMQWRMNPFAVAQKTFVSPSGALGYEGTLVAAALSTSGALEGDLRYEYIGDWSKVRGKFEKKESANRGNNNAGGEPKYYIVATYTKADEQGLGVRAIGRLRGEREDRVVELYLSQCYPRFSTQWANNPEQQIVYAVDRVWARRHKPSVMLGVYTEDELSEPGEKFMGPAEVVSAAATTAASYPLDDFRANLPQWTDVIERGKKTAAQVIAMVNASPKGALTEPQKAILLSIKVRNAPTDATDKNDKKTTDAFTPPAYAEVADKLHKAETIDQLNEAGDLIKHVVDQAQRDELQSLFETRETQIKTKE